MPVSAIKKAAEPKFDAKQAIIDKIGDLSEYEIAAGEVLLAIYQRPAMSPGGIYYPDQNLKEDIYQGKTHLVMKIGPGCEFFGLDVRLHDWVAVRPSDGWALDVNTKPDTLAYTDYVPCRMVLSKHIRAKIPQPGCVW
jgi:hypothetical protein